LTVSVGGTTGIPLQNIFNENIITGNVLVQPNIVTTVFEYPSPSVVSESSILTIDNSTTLILGDFVYLPLDEFQIDVTEIYNEEFAAWIYG